MASIYRRGGVWWCSYTGHDGKRRRESCHTRDRRAALQTATRREHLHWMVQEGLMSADHLRTHEKGKTMLESLRLADGKDNNVAAFLAWARKLTICSDFGGDSVVAHLAEWIDSERDRGLAVLTVNKKLWSIQRFGDWLWKQGYIAVNATLRVKPLKVKRGEPRKRPHDALTPQQAERLFVGEGGLYYRLRCFTGLRGSEAALLERRDLDLGDSPTITVRAEVAKNGYAYTLPLARSLADELVKHVGFGHPSGRVFGVSPDRAKRTRDIRRHLDAAGLPQTINGRSLRMAFVTWLEAAGVELGVRMKLRRDSGCGSVKLTNVTYSDPKQIMLVLRGALAQMEMWYAAQLRAREAVSA